MPVFQFFIENLKTIKTYSEEDNLANFQRYLEENGDERAKGYLEAMADFQKELDVILNIRHEGRKIFPHSDARIRKGTILLFEAQESFLKSDTMQNFIKNLSLDKNKQ